MNDNVMSRLRECQHDSRGGDDVKPSVAGPAGGLPTFAGISRSGIRRKNSLMNCSTRVEEARRLQPSGSLFPTAALAAGAAATASVY
jgi:hypothetical protein